MFPVTQKPSLRFSILILLTILLIWLLSVSVARSQAKQSNYAIHVARDFNQSGFYPLNQNPGVNYKPVADWVGRLILPTREELRDGLDWVRMEVESAPGSASSLVGKVIRLQWQKIRIWRPIYKL